MTNITVVVLDTAKEASDFTAQMIADTIKAKPNAVLCLATGGTPEPVYAELVKKHREDKLDF